jgi:hypothetical protein
MFGVPAALMSLYVTLLKLKRSWILGRKKKLWSKAKPLQFDDFEDTRGHPDTGGEEFLPEEDVKVDASASLNEILALDQAGAAAADSNRPKTSKAEAKAAEGLSELEKILRQVDD